MQKKLNSGNIIAFQGEPGAYSNLACRTMFPDMTTLPCHTFEDVFSAVEESQAKYAMIPLENSVAGQRVFNSHSVEQDHLCYGSGEREGRAALHWLVRRPAVEQDVRVRGWR